MTQASDQIAFVGTGQMATALAAGFVRNLLRPDQISGCDPNEAARKTFTEAIGYSANVSADLKTTLKNATVIVLAVKPQMMAEALQQVSAVMAGHPLVISVAAGIPVVKLAAGLPEGTRIVRVMPNTPCLIGKGACGVSTGPTVTSDDVRLVTVLLETVGLVEFVSEQLLDAVTGLSGSGPAYIFQLIEALSDGGVKMGLPRGMATRLAAQTVAGAAEMVLATGQHPAALKDAVTSPGGTTIAGIHALECGGFRASIINAVEASATRSKQLGH